MIDSCWQRKFCSIVALLFIPYIDGSAKWIQNGVTVAGGNGQGSGLNQLTSPHGIYVDDDQTIYIADLGNHRIMTWKHDATAGEIVAGGNGRGDGMNQLD